MSLEELCYQDVLSAFDFYEMETVELMFDERVDAVKIANYLRQKDFTATIKQDEQAHVVHLEDDRRAKAILKAVEAIETGVYRTIFTDERTCMKAKTYIEAKGYKVEYERQYYMFMCHHILNVYK